MTAGEVDGWELLRSYGGWIALVVVVLLLASVTVHRLRDPHLRRGLALWWRLRWRLYPGPGFAKRLELWRHYGRPACQQIALRARPSLGGRWDRARLHHREIAVFLGWAQGWLWRFRCYATLEDIVLVLAPHKEGKSAWLAGRILDAPGAVVATSIRTDLVEATAGLRSRRGRVHVFNPEGVGDFATTVRWSPVDGCENQTTAIRRAAHLVAAADSGGVSDQGFWTNQAAMVLAALLHAAALARLSLAEVYAWIVTDDPTPVKILQVRRPGLSTERAAAIVGRYLASHSRTRDSIAMTLRQVLRCMEDPATAWTVCPDPGEGLNMRRFLTERGTLYLVAGEGEHTATPPLFAALVAELHHEAHLVGSRLPYGRLDPPVTFALDEAPNICPVPLNSWLSTAAGSGMVFIVAAQSFSQIEDRWGARGAKTIWNSSKAKLFFGGTSDPEDLERVSQLCGEITLPMWEESRDARGDRMRTKRWETVRVLPTEQARMLPTWRAVAVRRNVRPTIVRVERVWARADVKRWNRAGAAIPLPRLEHGQLALDGGLGAELREPYADELASRRSARATLDEPRPRPGRPWDIARRDDDPDDDAAGQVPASPGGEA